MPKLQPVSSDKTARFDNVLALQKQSASLCANTVLVIALIFLALIGISAGAEFYHEGTLRPLFLFGMLPVLLVFTMMSFVRYAVRLRLLLRIRSIRYTNSCKIRIHCKKVYFLSRAVGKNLSLITWIVLTDEQGKKYYYIYPKDSEPLDYAKPLLKQHFEGQNVTLICYRDTHIIKSLDLPKGLIS